MGRLGNVTVNVNVRVGMVVLWIVGRVEGWVDSFCLVRVIWMVHCP